MGLYCVNNLKCGNTAGSKAPADCFSIAKSLGAKELVFRYPKTYKNVNVTRFFALFIGLANWCKLFIKTKRNSYVIIQHPNEGIEVARFFIPLCKKIKGIKFIALIHDLESLRQIGVNGLKQLQKRSQVADNELLTKCECIIAHNPQMRQYLINNGFSEKQVYSLGVFDYLCEDNQKRCVSKNEGVIVAGNLARYKCPYLYKYLEENLAAFKLNLYGPNFDGCVSENVEYHGQFSPEALVANLAGSFGLVWDGAEIDTCAGKTGEYLRYNNPHKLSMLLAANIPVIIWNEAALAGFVRDNNIGICVKSLSDIRPSIEALSSDEYVQMVSNAQKIGKKIRDGDYLTDVLKLIIGDLQMKL